MHLGPRVVLLLLASALFWAVACDGEKSESPTPTSQNGGVQTEIQSKIGGNHAAISALKSSDVPNGGGASAPSPTFTSQTSSARSSNGPAISAITDADLASIKPAPTPAPVAQAPTAQMPAPSLTQSSDPDRTSCNSIRGTAYRSDSERSWFLANCKDAPTSAASSAASSSEPTLCGGQADRRANGGTRDLVNGCADGTTIMINGASWVSPTSVGQPCYVINVTGSVQLVGGGVFYPAKGEVASHERCVLGQSAPESQAPEQPAPPAPSCNPNGVLNGSWTATGKPNEWKLDGPATITGNANWTINTDAPYSSNPGLPPEVSKSVQGAYAWCDPYTGPPASAPQPSTPPAAPSSCDPNGILGGHWTPTGNQNEWKLDSADKITGNANWTIHTKAPYDAQPGLPPGKSLDVDGAIAWCDSFKG